MSRKLVITLYKRHGGKKKQKKTTFTLNRSNRLNYENEKFNNFSFTW